MNRAGEDDYLWDRSGPVDDQVAELERLLGRFAASAGTPLAGARPARTPPRRAVLLMAAAAVLLVGAGVWTVLALRAGGGDPDGIEIIVVGPRPEQLAPGDWLAEQDRDVVLRVGAVGEVTVAAGSRLRVDDARRTRAALFLEHGQIEAFIAPAAGARFFQVKTPVTVCVDLGCKYVLQVDEETGETRVRVELGQVAFESDGRAVVVPRGAESRAVRDRRLGTPRFVGLPFDLRELLEIYDDSELGGERRLAAASKLAAIASMPRDTLPLWHMLADPDPRVVRAAETALVRIADLPPSARSRKQLDGIDPAVWRAHLEGLWW